MPDSHIRMDEQLERIQVAHWAQMTETAFLDLDSPQQARLIAAHRTIRQLDAVVEYEQARKLHRRPPKRS